MAETNIRLSPETMSQRSKEFMADAESFVSLHGQMKTRTENLATEWEGTASTSYIEQFHSLDKTFGEMQTLMETIAAQLQQAANTMIEADRQIASQLGVK